MVELPHSKVVVITISSDLASTIPSAAATRSEAASAIRGSLPQLLRSPMQHSLRSIFIWVARLLLVLVSFGWQVLSAPMLFWLHGVLLMFKLFIYVSKLVEILVCGIVRHLLVSVTFSISSVSIAASVILHAICYFSVGVIIVVYALLLELEFTLIFYIGNSAFILCST
jgi:hypothetical protein